MKILRRDISKIGELVASPEWSRMTDAFEQQSFDIAWSSRRVLRRIRRGD